MPETQSSLGSRTSAMSEARTGRVIVLRVMPPSNATMRTGFDDLVTDRLAAGYLDGGGGRLKQLTDAADGSSVDRAIDTNRPVVAQGVDTGSLRGATDEDQRIADPKQLRRAEGGVGHHGLNWRQHEGTTFGAFAGTAEIQAAAVHRQAQWMNRARPHSNGAPYNDRRVRIQVDLQDAGGDPHALRLSSGSALHSGDRSCIERLCATAHGAAHACLIGRPSVELKKNRGGCRVESSTHDGGRICEWSWRRRYRRKWWWWMRRDIKHWRLYDGRCHVTTTERLPQRRSVAQRLVQGAVRRACRTDDGRLCGEGGDGCGRGGDRVVLRCESLRNECVDLGHTNRACEDGAVVRVAARDRQRRVLPDSALGTSVSVVLFGPPAAGGCDGGTNGPYGRGAASVRHAATRTGCCRLSEALYAVGTAQVGNNLHRHIGGLGDSEGHARAFCLAAWNQLADCSVDSINKRCSSAGGDGGGDGGGG
eukprot:4101461-Prymnesium_polylepis.1